MHDLVAVPLLAFVASLFFIPMVRALSVRLNIVDKPDAHRKMHERVIPLGGGLGVLAAMLLAIGAASILPNSVRDQLQGEREELLWLLFAAVVLCGVGIVDDKRALRGSHKLAGQIVAVLIAVFGGLVVERISFFGYSIALGPLAIPFTVVWMIAAINALNLIDGVDGLATSVGIILCSALACMAFYHQHGGDAALALAMVGALFGFLYFNFPPATIFLGDTGSMLIGFIAGALALRSSSVDPSNISLVIVLSVWSIPLFDTGVAFMRRKLTGRSIYSTDRGHLHHCLLRIHQTPARAVAWIATLCALTTGGALVSVYLGQELFALLTVVVVIAALVSTGVFGHAEFMLLVTHGRNFLTSVFKPISKPAANSKRINIQLQGSRNWEEIWDQLQHSAELLEFNSVKLDVNLPALHEGYHGAWHRTDKRIVQEECWMTVVPIVVNGRAIGRLEISGTRRPQASVYGRMGQLADLLESIESRILDMMKDMPVAATDGRVHISDSPQRQLSQKVRLTGFWPIDAGS
ncbi:MAG: MraY family glycosyltransferase [Planctomycetota bacterium]